MVDRPDEDRHSPFLSRMFSRSRAVPVRIGVIAGAVALTTGLLTFLPSGGDAGASSAKPLIIYVSPPTSLVSFSSIELGAANAAKTYGVSFQFAGLTNMNNFVADYVTELNEAIGRHPAGLVVGDWTPSSFDPVFKQAAADGIPVVILDDGIDNWQADHALAFVGYTAQANGQASGQQALAVGVHHLLCVDEAPSTPFLTVECNAAGGVMKAAGGTETQLNIPTQDLSNPAAEESAVQGYLSSHHDIDGVWDDSSGAGDEVIQAVANLGETGKIKVGSDDITPSTLVEIQKGTLAWDINKDPYLEGYYAVQILAQYLEYHVQPTSPILTGGIMVSKQNVGAFMQVEKEYPGVLGPA
jgi:simple sugar transport system substrate-binding protein